MNRKLTDILKDDFKITAQRQVSHLHLKTPLAGIVLSDSWLKLALDTTNLHIKTLGEFTFDDANDRIYWDAAGNLGYSLPALFIGDAGLQVTSTVVTAITITLGLFIDDVLVLETPITFDKKETIQGYGANDPLLDSSDEDLLQSGSYYDFRIKASTGDTPTITLNYFNTTI